MANNDIPKFTDHEVRALIYIYEVEDQQKKEEKPPTISELADMTDWESKYYTRSWKRLQPKNLVNRKKDGQLTRLELTEDGAKVAEKLLEINQVLN